MKRHIFAVIAAAIPLIQATVSLLPATRPLMPATQTFSVATGNVKGQINSLAGSIARIRAVAQLKGHVKIVAKCDEATGHLQMAQKSFGFLSSGFLASPWRARLSSHAIEVRYRLSLCGTTLSWIFAQNDIRKCSQYRQPVQSCQSAYTSTQTACSQIWLWPAPTPAKDTPREPPSNGGYAPPSNDGYAPPPKPSQAHSGHGGGYGYGRRSNIPEVKLCLPHESICPIVFGSKDTECLDTKNEVASCGGCVSKNEGENCLDIPGADGVGCSEGTCVVFSVKEGYTFSAEGRPVKA